MDCPAPVAGSWEWEGPGGIPFRVELKQKYQEVEGRAWRAGQKLPLEYAELRGDRLELAIGEEDALDRFTLKFVKGKLRLLG